MCGNIKIGFDVWKICFEMEKIKKVDLHIHLGGSFPLSFLEKISLISSIDSSTSPPSLTSTPSSDFLALKNFLSQIKSKEETDYHSCFYSFSLVNKIISSNLFYLEEGTFALCQELIERNVIYIELRTGLKNYNNQGYEKYFLAVQNGIKRGCEGSQLIVKVILSLKRDSSVELAQETLRLIELYRSEIVGLDISDDALIGDKTGILSILPEIHRLNVPIALHLGECIEETEEQQLNELELFNPRRIGHGVFLCDKAKEWIFSRRLPIEMCLSSSVQAHMIQSENEHPALQLLLEGYPIAICTDDPLIFGTNHTEESLIVQRVLGNVSNEYIENIHLRSLDYKFS